MKYINFSIQPYSSLKPMKTLNIFKYIEYFSYHYICYLILRYIYWNKLFRHQVWAAKLVYQLLNPSGYICFIYMQLFKLGKSRAWMECVCVCVCVCVCKCVCVTLKLSSNTVKILTSYLPERKRNKECLFWKYKCKEMCTPIFTSLLLYQ